jgi:hypothetical protein
MWWDDTRLDVNQTTFGMPSYVGSSHGGAEHEAINTMAAVMTGLFAGFNMGSFSGPGFKDVNFVNMLNNYFDITHGNHVWKNTVTGDGNGEFWYQVWINILPMLVTWAETEGKTSSSLDWNIQAAVDSWFIVEEILGGGPGTLPNFNYTGYDFNTKTGVNNGKFTEPEAAGGLAFLMYAARAKFGDPTGKYLQGAVWAIEYLLSCNYDVFWEILVPFGAVTAARMNAELHTNYDVAKLINWVLQDDQCPARPPFRWGWGTFAATWQGVDVSGVVGSVTDNGGYAFAMDTYVALAAMLPIARYDPRYAHALAKWATNIINSARLFFPDEIAEDMQTDWSWVSKYDPGRSITYEGLRCHGPDGNGPFGTGDARGSGLPTNLALYGASYVGLMAAMVRPTGNPRLYGFDLLVTDWYHAPAHPSVLYYNPLAVNVTVSIVVLAEPSTKLVDVVDVVASEVIATAQKPNSFIDVNFAGDTARLIVFSPVGS